MRAAATVDSHELTSCSVSGDSRGGKTTCLRLAAEGARNKDIASALHISIRTVDTHVTNVLRKLDVHSKLEAAALLQKSRELRMDPYVIPRRQIHAIPSISGIPN